MTHGLWCGSLREKSRDEIGRRILCVSRGLSDVRGAAFIRTDCAWSPKLSLRGQCCPRADRLQTLRPSDLARPDGLLLAHLQKFLSLFFQSLEFYEPRPPTCLVASARESRSERRLQEVAPKDAYRKSLRKTPTPGLRDRRATLSTCLGKSSALSPCKVPWPLQ